MSRASQRFLLALIVICGGILIVVALFWRVVPEPNQRIMDLVSGIVLGWGGAAISYYFGTSEGSARKTEMLNARAAEVDAPGTDGAAYETSKNQII